MDPVIVGTSVQCSWPVPVPFYNHIQSSDQCFGTFFGTEEFLSVPLGNCIASMPPVLYTFYRTDIVDSLRGKKFQQNASRINEWIVNSLSRAAVCSVQQKQNTEFLSRNEYQLNREWNFYMYAKKPEHYKVVCVLRERKGRLVDARWSKSVRSVASSSCAHATCCLWELITPL